MHWTHPFKLIPLTINVNQKLLKSTISRSAKRLGAIRWDLPASDHYDSFGFPALYALITYPSTFYNRRTPKAGRSVVNLLCGMVRT